MQQNTKPKSGLILMLKAFGIEFDPEEIKQEAFKFRDVLVSIEHRLERIEAMNAAIALHLKIEGVANGRSETGGKPAASVSGDSQRGTP